MPLRDSDTSKFSKDKREESIRASGLLTEYTEYNYVYVKGKLT